MPAILITRPLEEAEALVAKLVEKGFSTFTEPLLHVEEMPENKPALEAALARKPQAILVTSRNSLRTLGEIVSSPIRGERINPIPLYVVGTATARHAKSLGFTVAGFAETAQALCELAAQKCDSARPLLYARGEDISADIAAVLGQKGFHVDCVVLYRAIAAGKLSEELCNRIINGGIAGAVFFSRRTATVYTQLAQQHALTKLHTSIRAVCISDAVAEALRSLPWRALRIAAKPDMEHMLEVMGGDF